MSGIVGWYERSPYRGYHAIGTALQWVDPSKIVMGLDLPFDDTKRVVDWVRNLQIPDELQKNYGYPEITDEMRAGFLGQEPGATRQDRAHEADQVSDAAAGGPAAALRRLPAFDGGTAWREGPGLHRRDRRDRLRAQAGLGHEPAGPAAPGRDSRDRRRRASPASRSTASCRSRTSGSAEAFAANLGCENLRFAATIHMGGAAPVASLRAPRRP